MSVAGLSDLDWHQRYMQQASWTAELRKYIFQAAGLDRAQTILEVGCGTGAILYGIPDSSSLATFGLDLDIDRLRLAARLLPGKYLTCGNALSLPFPGNRFDLVFCHFLLLWVSEPQTALLEMARVVRPGGYVIAFAEPDYGGRIDYPSVFEELGMQQTEALQNQGADPLIGRRLNQLFSKTGLADIESGIIGAQWKSSDLSSDWVSEWKILKADLLKADLQDAISGETLIDLQERDRLARKNGERTLFVPTFYAWGKKP